MDDSLSRFIEARKKGEVDRNEGELPDIHDKALLVHLLSHDRFHRNDAQWKPGARFPLSRGRIDRHDCQMGAAINLADIGDVSYMLLGSGTERLFHVGKLAPDELTRFERRLHQ